MREHYDQPMCLSELADMERVAPAYFCRRFREVYGTPPIHYLLGLRVERARELLATSGLTVTDVAERVGFGSVHYFTRYFAKRLGMPPALYRARCRAPRQSAG